LTLFDTVSHNLSIKSTKQNDQAKFDNDQPD